MENKVTRLRDRGLLRSCSARFRLVLAGACICSACAGETLWNGIELPHAWPPKTVRLLDRTPQRVPYLEHPPAVVPIDVGRQLFVDDFLIDRTDLRREFHYPEV